MRFSILGFNQDAVLSLSFIEKTSNGNVVERKLDMIDLLLLNHIADFPNRTRVKKIMEGEKVFFWAAYQTILDELPILDMKKQALADRFTKLEKMRLIERRFFSLDAEHQNMTFFCLTDVYESLLYDKNGGGYRSQLQEGIVVNYDTPSRSEIRDYNNITKNNNIKKNKEKKRDNKLSLKEKYNWEIVDHGFEKSMRMWIDYKKEKKQTYTPTGFKMAYARLKKLSQGNPDVAQQIVEVSMANNYAGLFPLKDNDVNKSSLPVGMILKGDRDKIIADSKKDLWD